MLRILSCPEQRLRASSKTSWMIDLFLQSSSQHPPTLGSWSVIRRKTLLPSIFEVSSVSTCSPHPCTDCVSCTYCTVALCYAKHPRDMIFCDSFKCSTAEEQKTLVSIYSNDNHDNTNKKRVKSVLRMSRAFDSTQWSYSRHGLIPNELG